MEIEIQARSLELDATLRGFVVRRLYFALGRFCDRVRRVIVRLEDVNGPRGGVDKRCQMVLRVNGLPDIVVADTESQVHAAVSRASERAARTLGRSMRRLRTSMAPRLLGRPRGFA